jgi:dihydroflavonol-4-reductase
MSGFAAVTGANGFVGSNLCDTLLSRGWKVRGVVRPSSNLKWLDSNRVEIHKCRLQRSDELDKALSDVDVVFHCAAQTSATSILELMQSNRDATRAVAHSLAKNAGGKTKLVLVSSVAASGPGQRGIARQPQDPCTPVSNYGISKRAGEIVASEMCGSLPVVIVRPGPVYGQRDMEFLQLFRTLKRLRLIPIPGYTSPSLSMIHVDDLVEILIRAAEQGQAIEGDPESTAGRGYYFAAENEPTSLSEFGHRIGRSLGIKRMVNLPIPLFVANGIAIGSEMWMKMWGRKSNLTRDKIREASAPSWAVSPASTISDLKFRFPLPMQERINQTIHWYRTEGLL